MHGARAAGTWVRGRRLLTTGLLAIVTAIAFEGLAVPTVLPATVGELGGLELYGWAFSSFFLTNLVGVTVGGADADRRGPARAFAIGVALFAGGVLVAGLAPGMMVVISGRAIQGFGAGAIGAVVYAAIARAYTADAMPRMIALVSSAWVVPGLVGPAIAGTVADALGWRWVFLGIVPPIVLMGCMLWLPLARLGAVPVAAGATPAATPSAPAAVRLALGATLFLAACGTTRPLVAVALGVPGVALAVHALGTLVPAGSLRARRGKPAVVALVFAVAFAFFGAEAFVPLAVTTVRGASTTIGGLALSAAALGWTTGAWLQARLTRGGRRRALVAVGALGIAAGIGVTALVLLPGAPIAIAAAGWAIAGLGMGLAYSTLSLLVLETADPGEEGASAAALQLMFTLGTAIGAGVGGAVVAVGDAIGRGLAPAIGVVDAIMLAGALAAAALARRVPETRALR